MARRQIVELIDDLDGTPLDQDGETITFSVDSTQYEIDLSPANAVALRESLAPYVKAGRRLGRGASVPASSRRRAGNDDHNAIRDWARANGHAVSDRGRISGAVIEAYQAANG